MFLYSEKFNAVFVIFGSKLQQYSVPEYFHEFFVSLKVVVAKQKRKINVNASLRMPLTYIFKTSDET